MSYSSFDHPALNLARRLVNPMIVFTSLFLAVEITHPPFTNFHLILGTLAFLLSTEVFDSFEFFEMSTQGTANQIRYMTDLVTAWAIVLGLLALLGMTTNTLHLFPPIMLVTWAMTTPVLLFLTHAYIRSRVESMYHSGSVRRAVIVGANALGYKLATHIHKQRNLMVRVEAFFDDRQDDRSDPSLLPIVAGGLNEVAAYVEKFGIDLVYISFPIIDNPRIVSLVNSLRDTTASVYFVPNIFIFDLVQARLDYVNGIPVIGVFESPLVGINAIHKRIFDVVVSSLILLMISPLMILLAIGVKLSSPGPVFFKQRRYGMDGEEILVYKFRSMRTMDNGDKVEQAKRNDARVTPFGAFIRKTSLDELPQMINVLQGKMSIVGPRPHAVAHNEHYRKLIHGYMWRHKVKPGITGLAQVSGFRGETDTIEKMEGRVLHDIIYLKNWSIWLDILIILKTIKLVFSDSQAY